MISYYKIPAFALKQYLLAIEKRDFGKVMQHVKNLLKNKGFYRDDVDYPEAIEVAEQMAFGVKPNWKIDEFRWDEERWVSDACLQRILLSCQKQDQDIVAVITTVFNHAPGD